jgi:hypothetical protein
MKNCSLSNEHNPSRGTVVRETEVKKSSRRTRIASAKIATDSHRGLVTITLPTRECRGFHEVRPGSHDMKSVHGLFDYGTPPA